MFLRSCPANILLRGALRKELINDSLWSHDQQRSHRKGSGAAFKGSAPPTFVKVTSGSKYSYSFPVLQRVFAYVY